MWKGMDNQMRELIRFAWGGSFLGDYMVAASDRGVIAVEFADQHSAMEDALRARFPAAEVVEDQDGLANTLDKIGQAIECPGVDINVVLDMRGSPFDIDVWTLLGQIPAGTTTSYGALALKLGTTDARPVTESIAANPIAVLVPCHRVIKKDGSISGYRWGVERKRKLLEKERNIARQGERPNSDL
jgi:AraC family transcriptional regulator of adaptative response/methylated-DNA-[protein]-cysteine methyltransferase